MPPRTVKQETDVVVPRAGEMYVADDGTVSQVLDDHIDESYEPTEEEVLEFADWIGMKLPQDSELLWLAREGLKTPLPKEWKPCSTNEGEVYYFNFKTGESSWDHPLDGVFRQRFEQEKEKARARKPPAAVSSSGAATPAGSASASKTAAPAIQQTHVMLTDTGVLRRDTGPASSTSVPNPATAHGSKVKSRDETKPVMHQPPKQQQQPQQQPGAVRIAGGGGGPQVTGASSSSAPGRSPAVLTAKKVPAPEGAGNASVSTSMTAASSFSSAAAAAPHRIMSEAERALEERVRREMAEALESERCKIDEAHHATMSALQRNYDTDVAELRRADAARRATSTQHEEEERERRLQQTRTTCEEMYGDELRALEREAEQHATRLQKLEAEAARATSGNTQRAAVEAELKAALASQRAEIEATARRQHEEAVAAAQATQEAALQRVRDDEQERVKAAAQSRQRKLDAEELALALQAETQRRKLEAQLKELEGRIAAVESASSPTTVNPAAPTSHATASGDIVSPSGEATLAERLNRIATAKEAQLRDVEAAAAAEQATVRSGGEAVLAELGAQIQQAQQAQQQQQQPHASSRPLSGVSSPAVVTSREPSFASDRPVVVTVQSAGRTGSGPALSVAYTQELNRIRLARGRERQERLTKLRGERDAALAAVTATTAAAAQSSTASVAKQSAPGSTTTDAAPPISVDELKTAHAAEVERKKALYARLEAELQQQCTREAAEAAGATTAAQQTALVAKAVEAEMDLYVQEATARHDRLRAEATAKREKALADHQLAMEAYERRKAEAAARQAREAKEAKEAVIASTLDTAVAAETTRLAAEHAAVMARLSARYDEERAAVQAEVEEELAAYEAAERQKAKAAAAASTSSSPATTATATAAPSDSPSAAEAAAAAPCAQLRAETAAREAEWAARKRTQAAQRAALEEREAVMTARQTRAAQQVRALTEEVAALGAAVAAAPSPLPGSATAATPPPPPPPPSALQTPPAGYRLRTVHDGAMQALEHGFRAQEAALEAELQSWRAKARAIPPPPPPQQQQAPPHPSYAPAGLSTPLQQVLTDPPASAAAGGVPHLSSTPYGLRHQPSPIPAAAAGVSWMNTPTHPVPLEPSPWPSALRRSSAASVAGTTTAAAAAASTSAPSTTSEAIVVSEQQRRLFQQRQASLQAAREAWLQQRRRDAEAVQLQRHLEHEHRSQLEASAAAAAEAEAESAWWGRQEQLSRILSHLGDRLDTLNGQAASLQPHAQPSPRQHRRGHSAARAEPRSRRTAAASTTAAARAQSAHLHHPQLSTSRSATSHLYEDPTPSPQSRRPSQHAVSSAMPRPRQAETLNGASATSKANAARGSQPSRHGHGGGSGSRDGLRGDASASAALSSKWDALLSGRQLNAAEAL